MHDSLLDLADALGGSSDSEEGPEEVVNGASANTRVERTKPRPDLVPGGRSLGLSWRRVEYGGRSLGLGGRRVEYGGRSLGLGGRRVEYGGRSLGLGGVWWEEHGA